IILPCIGSRTEQRLFSLYRRAIKKAGARRRRPRTPEEKESSVARVRGAALDGALVGAGDDAGLLEVVGEVRDAAHERAMVAGADRAVVDLVGDAAAGGERGVRHPRVAVFDDDGGATGGT